MIENPVQRTAVHESGDAVVASRLGIRFEADELRIQTVGGMWHCGGRLRGAELPEMADRNRLWAQLTVVMAGYASESLCAPSLGFSLEAFKTPDDRDLAAAIELLRSIEPTLTHQHQYVAALERAWHDARTIVFANWKDMTTLADELVRRTLRNGEVVECHIALTPKDVAELLAATA